MRNWTVREAVHEDLEEIRRLFSVVWGYNRPLDFDQWRYFNGPEGPCPAVLALDGRKVIGFYTGLPTRMRLGPEVISGIQSMDTLTHPDYQRQGIFITLAEACYALAKGRGFEMIYGFPNANSYPGFVNRLNFDHCGDFGDWVRPIRPSGYLRLPPALHKALILLRLHGQKEPVGVSTFKSESQIKPRSICYWLIGVRSQVFAALSEQQTGSIGAIAQKRSRL